MTNFKNFMSDKSHIIKTGALGILFALGINTSSKANEILSEGEFNIDAFCVSEHGKRIRPIDFPEEIKKWEGMGPMVYLTELSGGSLNRFIYEIFRRPNLSVGKENGFNILI